MNKQDLARKLVGIAEKLAAGKGMPNLRKGTKIPVTTADGEMTITVQEVAVQWDGLTSQYNTEITFDYTGAKSGSGIMELPAFSKMVEKYR